jgi:uncharacterized membrane protein YfcA
MYNAGSIMQQVWIFLIVLIAVFTQSVTGFGVALVAMALLPPLIGIRVATPLVALVSLVLEGLLLVRYRKQLQVHAIWRVTAAALVGIPLGLAGLELLDERLVLGILGVVISAYALYSLFGLHMPELKHPVWAYAAGLFGGMLGGAYNTSGPPVIVYADSQRWPPIQFKANLRGFFIIATVLVVAGHLFSRHITPLVWRDFLWTLPAILVGFLGGTRLDGHIDALTFRKIALVVLMGLGLRLIF